MVHFPFDALAVEGNVEDSEDLLGYMRGGLHTTSCDLWPFLDGQELIVSQEGAKESETGFEYLLHEGFIVVEDGFIDKSQKGCEAFGGDFASGADVEEEAHDGVAQVDVGDRGQKLISLVLMLLHLERVFYNYRLQQREGIVVVSCVRTAEVSSINLPDIFLGFVHI